MSSEARVGQIYIASKAGEPMRSVEWVNAFAFLGLEGDRYYEEEGFWQNVKNPRITARDVTLISEEAIIAARRDFGQDYSAVMTRRNLIIHGAVDLSSLMDEMFMVGNTIMRGVEECTPCNRPSTLSGIKGFEKAFKSEWRAGIRAEILGSGIINVGDRLSRLVKVDL